MADQQTVEQLVDYYVNLLIIQYTSLPKATQTITLLAEIMMASGVFLDVENAYNVYPEFGPTAVGKQLDVIGKYVGVDRFYTAIDLVNYFATVLYSQAGSLPSSPPAFGMSTYADFTDFAYNGTLRYGDIVTSENALNDTDFLTLIQFMILCNNMNYSAYSIDNALWEIFGAALHAETTGHMEMTFFILGPITTLISVILFKGLLPVPMGVGFTVIQEITDLMFALPSYNDIAHDAYSSFGYGFSTYGNYATLPGQVLTYSQIIEGS